MKAPQKKLSEQVMVITGATSGIGLSTAKLAAKKGTKLLLTARNNADLHSVKNEISKLGAEVEVVAADVADEKAMLEVAQVCIDKFGRIDTWVNNAAVSIYGKLSETHLDEKRRLFDVNFWGVVHGCRAAIRHLKKSGGVIINIGSILSERAIPLQGMYCASKHAVKAYTDSLRMELEAEGLPIAITLIKPAAIDTPYSIHAKNHLGENRQPMHTPPVYDAEVVARTILACAERPVRDVYVGGSAKLYSLVEKFTPRLGDLYMEKAMMTEGQSMEAPRNREDEALYNIPHDLRVKGNYPGHVMKSSMYTAASLHPLRTALVAGSIVGVVSILRRKNSSKLAA